MTNNEILIAFQLDWKNILSEIIIESETMVQSNIKRYYKNREKDETYDTKSKKKLYKGFLRDVNKEIENITLSFELVNAIDMQTGDIKNRGLLMGYAYQQVQKTLITTPPHTGTWNYDILKSHYLNFTSNILIAIVKFKERKYIIDTLKMRNEAEQDRQTTKQQNTVTTNPISEETREKLNNVGIIENSNNKNPHPQIFKNTIAFELFEHMQKTVIDKLADYSFIYRIMHDDGFIHKEVTPSMFSKWFNNAYEIDLGKLKTMINCRTIPKTNIYKTAKQLYKP